MLTISPRPLASVWPARRTSLVSPRQFWHQLWHTSEEEARYQAFKYQGLPRAHLYGTLCIVTCTLIFCILWWDDFYLEETIFPKTFLLRAVLYATSAAFEAAACMVFYFVEGSRRYAARYHFFFGLWMVAVLSFDPHRIVILWDDETTYVQELAQWWRIYQPDYDTSNCGGLVVIGSQDRAVSSTVPDDESQHCYFNSYAAPLPRATCTCPRARPTAGTRSPHAAAHTPQPTRHAPRATRHAPRATRHAPRATRHASCRRSTRRYEAVYMIMIMGCMTVEGFYFRMPPYGFLLMIHLAVAIRVMVVARFGSVNTRSSADIMDSAGMYVILVLFFFAARPHVQKSRPSSPPPPTSPRPPSPSPLPTTTTTTTTTTTITTITTTVVGSVGLRRHDGRGGPRRPGGC